MIRFLPRKSGHLRPGLKPAVLDTGKVRHKLHSEQFIVPGAQDYDRVFGALNIVIVLNALTFHSAWGTLVLKCHRSR